MYECAQTAITKYHTLDGLKTEIYFLADLGGWKYRVNLWQG